MSVQKLTPSQLSLLREEEGSASMFNKDLDVLESLGYVQVNNLKSGTKEWAWTPAGKIAAQG